MKWINEQHPRLNVHGLAQFVAGVFRATDPVVIAKMAYWEGKYGIQRVADDVDPVLPPLDPFPQYVLDTDLEEALAGVPDGPLSASDLTSGTLDPARIADASLPAAKLAGQLADGQIPANIARDSEVATAVAGAVPTAENVPPGSTITVVKSGSAWPARPTSRSDVVVAWKGADPSPAIVNSGTGGMLNNVDYRLVTP